MPDEENQVVEEALEAPQAIDQAAESDNQHDERPEPAKLSEPSRKGPEYNWSETRRKMAELERRTQEQQETINRLSAQKAQEEELSPDDLLTVGQLQKVNAKRDQDTFRELQRHKEEILRLRYPDMDQVLSNENLELFEQQEPELAETLASLQGDPIKMRLAAYKMIKKTFKTEQRPSTDKTKAENNSKKPISVHSVGKGSAIGTISGFENGLTPELKKQLRQEMDEARKKI